MSIITPVGEIANTFKGRVRDIDKASKDVILDFNKLYRIVRAYEKSGYLPESLMRKVYNNEGMSLSDETEMDAFTKKATSGEDKG